MDKIIGMGNALVDALVKMDDDVLLEELQLPKGSMQLVDAERFDTIRRRTEGMKSVRSTGGCASNTMLALAHLGVPVKFFGKTGDDASGAFFEKSLQKAGVEVCLLKDEAPSGIASTFVSKDGERTFGTYLGAAAALTAADLTPDRFAGYAYLYIEGYLVQDHQLIERAMQMARQEGLQVCLDLASYNLVEQEREYFDALVTKYVDIVFANEREARAFTGLEPLEALEAIGAKCSVAVVKAGQKGSLVKKGTEVIQVLPCSLPKVVDTTGAGDFYAAGFLYGLSCGYSLEKCVEMASILATHVIQVVGTTLTKSRWEQIKLNIEYVLQAAGK